MAECVRCRRRERDDLRRRREADHARLLVRVRRDSAGLQYVSEHRYGHRETADAWYLKLTIGLDINDNRDKLPPVDDGYIFRLLVGADDGAARTFNVHIDWNGDPDQTPDQVLASALEQLAVE